MSLVRDHHVVSPRDLPNRKNLRAAGNLLKIIRVLSEFRGYPNDPGGMLDGLVPSDHGFREEEDGSELHACKDCYNCILKKKNHQTSLANGSWVGDLNQSCTELRWSCVHLPM